MAKQQIAHALIGKNVTHSFSKLIHEEYGGYPYELISIADEAELVKFFKARAFKGLNITVPYKETVIPLLDKLDERVTTIGAVNTVVNHDGVLTGYNTDYYGFDYTLEVKGIDVKGKKVLVLGAGGASKAVCAVLRDRGAGEIIVTARSVREGVITNAQALEEHSDVAVIINAAPMGMYPNMDASAIFIAEGFPHCEAVVDLIYNPLRTELLAESGNVIRANGLLMVVEQAAKAAELFNESRFKLSSIDIARAVAAKKRNIVLIGMPSCGKSTIGRLLAEKMGKKFIDTDALIEQRKGCSIREIFAGKGEAYFRTLEHEIVKEVSLLDGHVIATGGGVVLDKRNIDALKHNGIILYLFRDLELLTASQPDRPLSSSKEAVSKLFRERSTLYLGYCDKSIENNANEEKAIKNILYEWNHLEETL